MANLIVDGFDWMPSGKSDTERNRLFAANTFYPCDFDNAGVSLVPDVRTGRFGFGKAMSLGLANNNPGGGPSVNGYVLPIYKVIQEGFVGFAFYRGSLTHQFHHPGFAFYDAVTNQPQCFVEFAENGVVKAWNTFPYMSGAVVIANSYAGAFQEDNWFSVEAYGKIATVGGGIEVRINTVPVLQLVGADTQYTSLASFDSIFLGDQVEGGFVTNWIDVAWDDLFVNDTTGLKNNTWAGNLRVKTQFMIADGATNNFSIGGTSPAASHWQSVLNTNMDDGQYEYSPNVNDIDLFTPDPNLNSPLVRSLQVRMGLRQDDSTQRAARALLRIGGTNYLGSVDQYVNQTYTFYKERFETNPATGVDFTGADVNGLQAGLKITL